MVNKRHTPSIIRWRRPPEYVPPIYIFEKIREFVELAGGKLPEYKPHEWYKNPQFDPECWMWKGPCNKNGYPIFYAHGQMMSCHRFSYLAYIGEIPPKMIVGRLCDQKLCVNPHHLEPRPPRRAQNRILKQVEIDDIRYFWRISMLSAEEIAQRFGIGIGSVYAIVKDVTVELSP